MIQACHPVEVLNPTSNPRPFYLPFYSAPPARTHPQRPYPKGRGRKFLSGQRFPTLKPQVQCLSSQHYLETSKHPPLHIFNGGGCKFSV